MLWYLKYLIICIWNSMLMHLLDPFWFTQKYIWKNEIFKCFWIPWKRSQIIYFVNSVKKNITNKSCTSHRLRKSSQYEEICATWNIWIPACWIQCSCIYWIFFGSHRSISAKIELLKFLEPLKRSQKIHFSNSMNWQEKQIMHILLLPISYTCV